MSTFFGSIRAKLLAGFGALACIVAGAGAASHMQVGSMDESSRGLARNAALAEAAVEMEYLVARQMQMLMEMLVSRTQDELQAAWAEYEGFDKSYRELSLAVLKGGEYEARRFEPLGDAELGEVISAALAFQSGVLKKEILTALDKTRRALDLRAGGDLLGQLPMLEREIDEADTRADAAGEELIGMLGKAAKLSADKYKAAEARAGEAASTARAVSLASILLGLALASALGLLVSRAIVRQVEAVRRYAARVAEGDLSAGIVARLSGELADMAGHVQAMVAELKDKLGMSQGLMHGMTVPCVISDARGRVLFTNQACLDFLEREGRPGEIAGQDLGAFFYGESGRETLSAKVVREGRAVQDVQATLSTSRGGLRQARMDVAPIKDLDGEVIAAFAIITDLTDIKAKQEHIEKQNKLIASAASEASDVAAQVSSASEELAAQVDESSRGADLQRGRLSEAAAAMEQMNASVIEVARNAQAASDVAERTRSKALDGSRIVDEAVEGIEGISRRAEALRTDMDDLGRQAESIGRIMGVISDIADQTNLLALNAAIEAARAGEAGRGFAVVADEVRKLAEKTMAATTDVDKAIRQIQDSAQRNIQSTDETAKAIGRSTGLARSSGQVLGEIVGLAEQTAQQVRSIATASEQQSASSEQISRSTEEINRIASETAESMQQSAQAVSQLAELAGKLDGIIRSIQR